MKLLKIILISLIGIVFFANSPILKLVHPDYDVYYGYIKFIASRDILYAGMFCASFFLAAISISGLGGAIGKFLFIVSFASFFDVALLGINDYLQSDIILVMVAFEITIFQYLFYDRKTR